MSKEHIEPEDNLQKSYQLVQGALDNLYENIEEQNVEGFIEKIKVLEKYSFNKKKYFLLWDHQKYMPLYISDNCIDYGYTPEEIYNMTLIQGLKHLHWSQAPSIIKLINLGHHSSLKAFHKSPVQSRKSFICGAKIIDRYSNRTTFFIQDRILKLQKNGTSLLSLLIVEPINHLVKKNAFWIRLMSEYKGLQLKHTFILNSITQSTGDLLSDRQLEILQLIVQDKDIETIGQVLNISPETVKKHRKNMLARVGAKDISALIYLCQQCQLI